MGTGMRDSRTFDEFYGGTVRRVIGQLYALTGDRAEAEDVVQEAYARAWQRWEKVAGYGDPGGGLPDQGEFLAQDGEPGHRPPPARRQRAGAGDQRGLRGRRRRAAEDQRGAAPGDRAALPRRPAGQRDREGDGGQPRRGQGQAVARPAGPVRAPVRTGSWPRPRGG